MSNNTVLNSELNKNLTVVNNEIQQSAQAKGTVINPVVLPFKEIPTGTKLNNKYEVIHKMDISAGEADLYVCRYANQGFAAKVYRRNLAIKPEVIDTLKRINSPYVSRLYETGIYNGNLYEILPFYRNGSLLGKKYSLEHLKKHIIPNLNEGLHILHQNKVIHKDLKPSNIMLCDNANNVSIIDFGISSTVSGSNTVIVTQTGMTPEYSAPETFRNLYLEESDYYSLGITLFELFYGHTPYRNMTAEEIEKYISVQRIPFPEGIPDELKNLISALTYYDITNRKDKQNPNRRWTYEEVKRWCNGEKLPIPGEGGAIGIGSHGSIQPYLFLGEAYTSIPSLVRALAINWSEGKKQLYRGLISGFFKGFNPVIAGYCIDAEEETAKGGNEDIVFWKLIYKLDPDTRVLYWTGNEYQSLFALGRVMLEHLRKGDDSKSEFYNSIYTNKVLSWYVTTTDFENSVLKEAVSSLESSFLFNCKTQRDIKKLYYLTGYMLSGQKLFIFEDQEFRTVGEFAGYMKKLLEDSYEKFEDFCHKMIDYDDNLDIQLETWLISIGKRKELEQWRESLRG